MTPASEACPQEWAPPSGVPKVQLPRDVSFRVHCGLLTQTRPVPLPNTAATRNAIAPT